MLAGLTAVLVLFGAIVYPRFAFPRHGAGSISSPPPAGRTEPPLRQPSDQSAGNLAPPAPTANIPSPSPQLPLAAATLPGENIAPMDLGNIQNGSTVEFSMIGPDSQAMNAQANPFLIQVDVTFTDPGGHAVVVPTFFDGDGIGGPDGNVWKVRFAPDVTGEWTFASNSSTKQLSEYQGGFRVVSADTCVGEQVTDLRCKGRLEYHGSHFLRFENGDYWIKGGVDDPENFLGKAFGSWQEKKEALDYLASQGVNSIYVITNNIDGDGKDTWPWLGSTPQQAKQNSDRFDTARLAQWEDFFSHAESNGMVLHIVLDDDSAWNEYNHELYYREMIARFGHHPGIIWNIGEEANEIYSNDQQVELAQTLRAMDPYRHPVTVHRRADWPFVGNPQFDLTSIQVGDGAEAFSEADLRDLNQIVNNQREKSASAGRPIPVMIDETPGIDRVDESIRRKVRSQLLYPTYLGGGNFELHFRDTFVENGLSSLGELEPLLEDMQRARLFLGALPFHLMSSCNHLLSRDAGFCYGVPGRVYALYLPRGGTVRVDLSGMTGPIDVTWFDPRTGDTHDANSVQGGGEGSFTSPSDEDWVLRLNGTSSG